MPEAYSELKHPRRRFFLKTVNKQEPLTSFTRKFRLRHLTRLCTPKVIYYIKIKTGTSQSAERLQAPWGLFSAKFKATATELREEKTQLMWYEVILLTAIKS